MAYCWGVTDEQRQKMSSLLQELNKLSNIAGKLCVIAETALGKGVNDIEMDLIRLTSSFGEAESLCVKKVKRWDWASIGPS